MAVTTVTIRQLLQRITDGEVRIPAFQREFVWDPDRVQFLMDSIYKGYPIGTVLFWRTREKLSFDRDLGPFTLPDPKRDYPIDYVLDGQQRLTSIFATFQTELSKNPGSGVKWTDIYFDLSAVDNVQNSQFLALEDGERTDSHVPLSTLFNVAEFGRYTRSLPEDGRLESIYNLQAKFQEAQIPVETVETEEHSRIAIIFERINRGGVPLDTFQLLSAWTWSGDFDLRAKFDELTIELDEVGYSDLGSDPDLLLKCAAAVIKNDSSASTIVGLSGAEVRGSFDRFRNGLLGAIEFLRRDCSASSLKVLPYKTMMIPLTRCFATERDAGFHPNARQRDALKRWFWHSCFSRRYSNSVDNALSQDINGMIHLLDGNPDEFEQRALQVPPSFFKDNVFSLTSVNTKVFILILAQERPKSFLSAADVDLDTVLVSCNRTEFHHIFPKNYLANSLGITDKSVHSVLANFAFLSQHDNRSIKNKAPSQYYLEMPEDRRDEILDSSLVPRDGLNLSFEEFVARRAVLLSEKANRLIGTVLPAVAPRLTEA
jgi:hypothetical protein